MSVQDLNQTSVTPTLCVQTLKDPIFVAVKGDTKEMVEIVQVSDVLLLLKGAHNLFFSNVDCLANK